MRKSRSSTGKDKKKFSFKVFLIFIAFEIVFTGITAPLIIFYGPFKNVKKTMVGAAMTTLRHQWIATTFLSQDKINKILNEDSVQALSVNTKEEDVQVDVGHSSGDTNIERYEIKNRRFSGNVLIIHDPKRVKVGYSKKIGVEGQLTSQIAKDNNAVAAINGGGFQDNSSDGFWTGTGGKPTGVIISNGEIKYSDMPEDHKTDMMAITKDGRLIVGSHSIRELKELNVSEAISFGPPLIVNGKANIRNGDGGWGIAPRTAIGQRQDGAIVMIVIDGRQITSLGATLKDVQDILLEEYKVVNATNLDGGSSATMYYDGEIINNPSDALGERYVPSAIYVKP